MLRAICLYLLLMAASISVQAQNDLSIAGDSTKILEEVTVHAFEYDRPLQEVPAAIGVVKQKDFERFNNTSLLPALNTIPGVRMEERSPGSYRLSIRGSTLRSPFGIRNVKVYWNDLPFTDPGGNTYLNLLDNNSVQQAEIIKGPCSSTYGAGTGGVLLLKSPTAEFNTKQLQISTTAGSYGLFRYAISSQSSSEKENTNIQYAHQQADGYREQSAMKRDVLQLQGNFHVDSKRIISGNFFYGHINYETPGGLTKAEYDSLPKQANPKAVEKHAAVDNNTFYAGVVQEYKFNTHWSNRTGVYGTFTKFENSAIRNYERRTEQSFGGRSSTQYGSEKVKVNFGGEYQYGFSPIKTYKNNFGKSDSLKTDDELTSATGFLFAQTEFFLPANFFLTLGSSLNFATIKYTSLSVVSDTTRERNFTPVLSPRVALLKKINSHISIYGSFSQGFSSPTVAELYPTTAVFDNTLAAEKGNNYEVGVRGSMLNHMLNFDLTAYTFQLKNAISRRKNNDDGEYFVNAGNTLQNGLELAMSWTPNINPPSFINNFKLWASGNLNNYSFKNYTVDTVSYSGNIIAGTAPHIVVLGLDVSVRAGIYCNVTFNYTDRTPLNDANTEFAKEYTLLGCRAGYKKEFKKVRMDLFTGAENIFDQRYSLGNDLNVPNQRFYNAAMGRNFFVGLKMSLVSLSKR